MMMMMCRVMCVLAVVLCCACGYTMTAAAAVDNDSPSGRGVSRGAVEVSCGAGGALRVRPAAESEWLTCGAGSRVSACGKYADLCRQRTARATTTIATTTTTNGQPKAVMAILDDVVYSTYTNNLTDGEGTELLGYKESSVRNNSESNSGVESQVQASEAVTQHGRVPEELSGHNTVSPGHGVS
ncbi:uncharacterized protein TM35_000031760 [Trypanosoma theileri]|uniref:Mucin-associated surface protein (MASP) n=1 Tax=Trypanosoma theileri TaxID=67003 RepID=A0A1X0P707_9TRYP|nr:uncharacterized protein TM35_000031760 [Trypanosoma theileri]ORC92423.1 hypothetical protein TM35_000031760 [Trypanosoma theileri]